MSHNIQYCNICKAQHTWDQINNKWICMGCYDREHLYNTQAPPEEVTP